MGSTRDQSSGDGCRGDEVGVAPIDRTSGTFQKDEEICGDQKVVMSNSLNDQSLEKTDGDRRE